MEILTLSQEGTRYQHPRWTVNTGAIFELTQSASGAMFIVKSTKHGSANPDGLRVAVEMLLSPSARLLSTTRGLDSFTRHSLIAGRASFEHDSRLNSQIMVPERAGANSAARKAIWIPDRGWSVNGRGCGGFKDAAHRLTTDFFIVEPGQELRLSDGPTLEAARCTFVWTGASYVMYDGWAPGPSRLPDTLDPARHLLDSFEYVGPGRPAVPIG
jgi:hypothetical protein